MLVLSRKVGERIVIGDGITVVVQRIAKGRVSIAIEAPREVTVLRGELAPFGLDGFAAESEQEPPPEETSRHAGSRKEQTRRGRLSTPCHG